jgi:hypothetical protein
LLQRVGGINVLSVDLAKVDLPVLELPHIHLPTVSLPTIPLPNADEVRLSVVRTLDDIQDAVMTAPGKAQDLVIDLRESVTKSVVLVREAVGI